MGKLKIRIPWWYRLFIPLMPNFWEELPVEQHGLNYEAKVIKVYSFTEHVSWLRNYNSLQFAYRKVRWKALWTDIWTKGNYHGVIWKISVLQEKRYNR